MVCDFIVERGKTKWATHYACTENRIGDEGALKLSMMIKQNKTLAGLYVKGISRECSQKSKLLIE